MNKNNINRAVIITGGATGIGLSVAKQLGKAGFSIVIFDVDENAVTATTSSLQGEGIHTTGHQIDVTDEQQVKNGIDKIAFEMKGIFGLVNNAGVAASGSVTCSTLDDWQRVLAVNVMGTYLMSKYALPYMINDQRGSIVNLGSVAGLVGIPNMSAYCASKGAIVNLTRQMSTDYAKHGIRINCVCPGTVADTKMGKSLLERDVTDEAIAKRMAKYPIGRFGTTDEIASGIAYFMDDSSAFCSGAILQIDGGMTAM